MYRILTQKALDIDWFVYLLDAPIHIASNGGFIPRNTYKVRELEEVYDRIVSRSGDNDVEINGSYIERLEGYEYLDNQDFASILKENYSLKMSKVALYSESFVSMAERGFYSFDRVDTYSPMGYEQYRLIAWPKNSNSVIPSWCKDKDIPLVRMIQLFMREKCGQKENDGILRLNCDSKKFFNRFEIEKINEEFESFENKVDENR